MTVQELLNELRKYPKHWAVAYDYERHYMFYVSTIINNDESIILSCDVGIANALTVRQLASKLLKYDLDILIKVGHKHAYQVDKIKTLGFLVVITTKWLIFYINFRL